MEMKRIERLRRVAEVKEQKQDRQQQSNDCLPDRKQQETPQKSEFILKLEQKYQKDKTDRTATNTHMVKKPMNFGQPRKISRLKDQFNDELKKQQKINQIKANKGYEESIKMAEELGEQLERQKKLEER